MGEGSGMKISYVKLERCEGNYVDIVLGTITLACGSDLFTRNLHAHVKQVVPLQASK